MNEGQHTPWVCCPGEGLWGEVELRLSLAQLAWTLFCVCAYTCILMCLFMCMCTLSCMCVWVCTFVHVLEVHVGLCMCLCLYTCISMYMCMYKPCREHLWVCVYMNMYTHTYIYVYITMCARAGSTWRSICMKVSMYTDTCIHMCMLCHVPIYVHAGSTCGHSCV